MKKVASVFAFVLFALFGHAQNLVPNPSFEIYDTCPDFLSGISRALGWSSYSITPDYYNSCAPETAIICVSVPFNFVGFQYARTGNGYAGIITGRIMPSNNEREYIGIELTQTLNQGQRYYGSFYISKADIYGQSHAYTIASNKIGMRLSNVPYSQNNPVPTDNHAHIYSDSIIADTLNWVKISGSFIADSAYRYLSIGNFFVDSLTSYTRFDSVALTAYYYIDDVYLSDRPDSFSEGITLISNDDFIQVFPNPANNFFSINNKEFLEKVVVTNCMGAVVKEQKLQSGLNDIDISSLADGIYLLAFDRKYYSKIIVQH